ncbi:hypothetical protein Hypma_004982 [Hypsizygus marmoreus]|uniref:Peroxidase n=1 Tax=Hypsizygus marmoreus TaxID=39966 RepID=A0A369K2V3_HYPMA|nr:hypothetical protein Hypma_004982 [Hypsizygus marmoreus]
MKFPSSLLLLLGWHAFSEVACQTDVPALRRMMTNMRLVVLVSPCTVGPANRMLASEWLRVAFHDAGSHDAANGVGGIDGSFLYEMNYEENNGVFGSATMQQYRTIQERTVSLADIIVLGAITAIGSCGGPVIPFLGGRIDAKGPVTPGFLPSPGQTLATHQAQFARMGFSNKEMISLVACGHTIGGVHVANNPTITSEAMAGFDTTRAVFDNQGAIEYRNGVLANPLAQPVNASNLATSSDSRIFSSDNNATINSYAASQDTFFNDCSTVFSKMFNELVPRGTSLTSIKPYPVSVGLVYSLRNEVFQIQIGNARVFDLAGEWSSYDIIYHNRDGSLGTNSELLRVRTMRTLSNGAPIQIKDFSTVAPGIDPITGISSVSVVLTLNDGTIYSSEDGAETVAIEDRIVIDLGIPFSCIYTSPEGDVGLNISIAVLGPFSADDKVYIDYELASDLSRTTFGEPIRANFRAARPGTDYNYYGVQVPV